LFRLAAIQTLGFQSNFHVCNISHARYCIQFVACNNFQNETWNFYPDRYIWIDHSHWSWQYQQIFYHLKKPEWVLPCQIDPKVNRKSLTTIGLPLDQKRYGFWSIICSLLPKFKNCIECIEFLKHVSKVGQNSTVDGETDTNKSWDIG
jgi:hypothetical protein